tara:strand:+ start:5744 stop:7030 length:1287 start_codon:yes stop_codon:yes gene_type:complete
MKKAITKLSIITCIVILLSSCNNDEELTDPKERAAENNYALFTFTQGGSYNFNYYLQPIKNLEEETFYDNQNAVEIVTETTAGVYDFEGDFYTNTYAAPQEVGKWSYDEATEKFVKNGSFTTSEIGYAGAPCFKDENMAFIGGPSSNKILIFNPTTMLKTGAIDFSSLSRAGEVTNFPEPGKKINIEAPTEMIVRGNYLFIGFFLLNTAEPYVPASVTADIMVVDLTKVDANSSDNSNALVKWISSDKGVSVGSWNSAFGAKFMVVDEQNDIYILCHNFWGGLNTGKPNCILKIKEGETDFDPDYYFDLETASRGLGNPVLNLEYVGDGIFFGTSNDPSAINPDDPLSYYQDPIAQWYKFDLYNKTGEIVSDEYTRGSLTAVTHSENGKVYIPFQSATEAHIKEVDIISLEHKILFTTTGASILKKIK